MTKSQHFWTTYTLPLVKVVCERLLKQNSEFRFVVSELVVGSGEQNTIVLMFHYASYQSFFFLSWSTNFTSQKLRGYSFFIIMHHQKRKWLEKWALPFDSLAIFRQRQFKRTLAWNDKEMNELSLLDKLYGLDVINLITNSNTIKGTKNRWNITIRIHPNQR